MLDKLHKDAVEHFELKLKVEEKSSAEAATLCSLQDLSFSIQQLAIDFETTAQSKAPGLSGMLLIEKIQSKLSNKKLPPANQAAFFVLEHFFASLMNKLQIDPLLDQVYHCFALAWCQASVNDCEVATGSKSDFYKILEILNQLAFKIDPYAGKASFQYCDILKKYFLLFAKNRRAAADKLYAHVLKLEKESKRKRRGLLVENIKEYKKKTSKNSAKSIVAAEIRRCIGDGVYPVILLEFVENYYTLYLEDHYVKHGAKGDDWTNTTRDLSYLIWAFRAEVDTSFHRYFPDKIPRALNSIVAKVEHLITDKDKLYQDFLAMEEIFAMRKKHGQIKLDSVFNVTEISSDGLFTNPAVKWRMENPTDSGWYVVHLKDKETFCKLIGNDIFKNQLVFANYSGHIQRIYNTAEPSFQLEQVRATAATNNVNWFYILSDVEYEITSCHANFCERHHEAIALLNVDIKAQLLEQQKREKQLEADKKEAKNQLDQQRYLKAEQQKHARLKLIEQQQANKRKRIEYENEIDKVNLGTLITATLEDGSQASMELNVITSTTNRYIFNDQSCQHKLAITKDKMLDMLVTGKLTIDVLGRANDSNQVLANVIAKRRKHLDNY